MKKLIAFFILVFFLSKLSSQPGVEFQLGGSNFLGWTMNASYNVVVAEEFDFSICPYMGVGSMIFLEFGLDAIVHTGIDIRYKNWGIGGEASHFFPNPFLTDSHINEFIALLIYPNVSYLKSYKNSVFLKFSAGAYFAYDKGSNSNPNAPRYQFAGDIIPGASLTVGYRFRH